MKPGTDAGLRALPFGQAVRCALAMHTCPVSFWAVVERRDGEGDVLLPALSFAQLGARALPWVLVGGAVLGAWLWLTQLTRARDAALVSQAVTMQALNVETAARQAVTAALVRSEQALEQRERTRQTQAHVLSQQRGQLDDTLKALPWAAARVPDGVLERLRAAAADGDGGAGADATAEPAAAD